jgi:hypothetical protein
VDDRAVDAVDELEVDDALEVGGCECPGREPRRERLRGDILLAIEVCDRGGAANVAE